MSADEGFGPQETANYDFGNTAAPDGFDPNATGYKSPKPGEHTVTVETFKVITDKEFRWDGETYVLNQLRPELVIISKGDSLGARCMDFIPMPTPNREMAPGLANRWANFIKSLGFDVQKDKIVPDGFKLPDIVGRTANVTIKIQMDANKEPKMGKDGLPRTQVAMFGYSKRGEDRTASDTSATNAHTRSFDL